MNVMGIIFANDATTGVLTEKRTMASLPFASRYRLVDFVLSSMSNCGIDNVYILPNRNYLSLMDHLGSGKEWDLHTRNNGLFILPPYMNRENGGEFDELVLAGNTMKEFEDVFLCGMSLDGLKEQIQTKNVRVNRDGGYGLIEIFTKNAPKKA